MLVLGVGQFKDVKTDVVVGIGRIKIDHVVNALVRDLLEQAFHQFSVRVHHGNAFAVRDVLDDHVVEERALAGAGLPDHVRMLPPVIPPDAE